MVTKNSQLLISGALVFKEYAGKRRFLLVKQGGAKNWEIPKVTVRKGESSVRASIRMTSEVAGMDARVLEEAGRATGATLINGKSVPVKYYYYLMLQKSAGEMLGFDDFEWLEYGKAIKKIFLKREKDILRSGKKVLREWEKAQKKK